MVQPAEGPAERARGARAGGGELANEDLQGVHLRRGYRGFLLPDARPQHVSLVLGRRPPFQLNWGDFRDA